MLLTLRSKLFISLSVIFATFCKVISSAKVLLTSCVAIQQERIDEIQIDVSVRIVVVLAECCHTAQIEKKN